MMMKFDSSNVKLYMTIIQVYNNTLNDNATIYITINSVYGDINSHANGINSSTQWNHSCLGLLLCY